MKNTENSCLVKKLSNYIHLGERQLELLTRMEEKTQEVKKGQKLFQISDPSRMLYVVKEGWFAASSEDDDENRAITRVYIPGDIIGLDTICVKGKPEHFLALTDGKICPFPVTTLSEIFGEDCKLSTLFFYVLGRDSLLSRAIASSINLLQADERLAYFYLLLNTRLQDLCEAADNKFTLRMSQIEIGQTIALSQQQVNRSSKSLKDKGLIIAENRRIAIPDLEKLEKYCKFSREEFMLDIDEDVLYTKF